MMEPTLRLSVIIPTRSALPVLEKTLDSLARQTIPFSAYEVIVSAGVEREEVQRRVHANYPVPLQVQFEPGPGAARRRNAGASVARGSLLVFLDDDMVAAPGFLEAHYQAHCDGTTPARDRVVIGRLDSIFHPLAVGQQFNWLELDVRDWWEDVFTQMSKPGHRFNYTDLLSGNFSLPAALFSKVNGFNPDFHCREDYELGLRLIQAGAQFALCSEARSLHQDGTNLKRSLERKTAEGRADILFARLHPELASDLPFSGQIDNVHISTRILRAVSRRFPTLGRKAGRIILPLVPLTERLKLRRAWRQITAGLLVHAYWEGVFTQTNLWQEIRTLAGQTSTDSMMCIDLARGADHAEQTIDRCMPNGVRLTWNGYHLGSIAAQPGTEPITSRHLRAWLQGRGAIPTARAKALFAALCVDGDEAWPTPEGQNYPHSGEGRSNIIPKLSPEQPSALAEFDLVHGRPGLERIAGTTEALRVLLRNQGTPLGWLHLPGQSTPRSVPDLIYAILDQTQNDALLAMPQPVKHNDHAEISVIICTRGRVDLLQICVQALQNQTLAPGEIIVVDNAPLDERTAQVANARGVRYLREDRPGLDFARNCGLRAAQFPIVAYIDDDACPSSDWVAVLAAAFATQQVSAVTGFVAPTELATREQCLFEWVYGGMGHGFHRRLYRRDLLNSSELLWASGFGVGTNMTFLRSVLLESGGFDPALDVGGPAGGGGDVEIFHRLVAAGHSLMYEPGAIVWHLHRRNYSALRRQLFDNGRSFGAYLLTCAANHSLPLRQIAAFAVFDWLLGWFLHRLVRPGRLPRGLVVTELLGALLSPLAYLRAQRRVKKMAK